MMDIDEVICLVRKSAAPLYSELLSCLSHFPWKEVPEGWFQFGLMRQLQKAGYKSYPEYWLGNLEGIGNGRADVALFIDGKDFSQPSMLIELKAVGSSDKGFRTDAERLGKAAHNGVAGLLVYFTSAIQMNAEEKKEEFSRFGCNLLGSNATILDPSWHPFEERFWSMPEGSGLKERCWGILIAKFTAD